ncbi:UNVERIFIED_CONTAM: hypothetical protein BJ099_10540 [Lysinibacillus xylanilyticus]
MLNNIRLLGTMLVTKALLQDVMLLVFVPLPTRSRVSSVTLIPKESPSHYSNQLIHMTYVLTKCHPTFVFYRHTFTFYRLTFEFYRLTFTFYRPTFDNYPHPPVKEQKKIHTQNCVRILYYVAPSLLQSTTALKMYLQALLFNL